MELRKLGIGLFACWALGACGGGGGGGPATFNLAFEAPNGSGFATGQVDKAFAPLVLQDFNLLAGIAVSGQVTDGAAAPLANVKVSFLSSAGGAELDSDTTDGAGNYSVTLPAGMWVAELESGSSTLGEMSLNGVSVSSPGPLTQNFQFPATVVVTGTVSDSLGAGIDGAQVDFKGTQTEASVTVTADNTGFYMATLVPDTYEVVVTPGGAAPTQLKERFPSNVIAGPAALDFGLTEGVQVSGIVLTNIGTPLLDDTDIEVVLSQGSDFFPPPGVTANQADGTYTIGPVPPETVSFELEASGDSGFPVQRLIRVIVGPTIQIEDLMLAQGFVLSGTILWNDGVTPAVNCEVEPIPTAGGVLAPKDDKTDNAGFYEISLFAGTYNVFITPDDPTDLQLPEVRILAVNGPATLDATLTLGALLTGTVFLPGGVVPEPDIRVEIEGTLEASDVSDGSGVYTFLAPMGTHSLSLVAEDGAFEDMALGTFAGVVVSAPGPVTQDLTMALATTGSTVVRGIVYEPDGATPALGAEVIARHNTTGDVLGRAFSLVTGDYLLVIP